MVRKSAEGGSRRRSKDVELSLGGGRKLRHFRFVHRRHTAKLLHRRHTSHLGLASILAILGLFIFATEDMTKAAPQSLSQDVTITAMVNGPPPSIGATITSPVTGSTIPYEPTTTVNGTCALNTLVIISNNATVVGSTYCTAAGIFTLAVQLSVGLNTLTAKNYDGLNQPGPDTPAVMVTLVVPPATPTPPKITRPTALPNNFYTLNQLPLYCDGYSPPSPVKSDAPGVAVVCLPRTVIPGQNYSFGVLVWGGSPPYALDISFGDKIVENTLISIEKPGYTTVPFSYPSPGIYSLKLKLRDNDGTAGFVQTVVVVNGQPAPVATGFLDTILRSPWFESPVPLYLLAVALTLGFWLGDLFDRRFGTGKQYRRIRKARQTPNSVQ